MTENNITPAAKFIISASIEGFPVSVEVEGKADSLRAMIARLQAIGAEPPASSKFEDKPTDDGPVCEFHGKMKPSNHGGFFCTKKMGDGSYCKSKA